MLNEMLPDKFKDLGPEEALGVAIQSAKEINLILDKADCRTRKEHETY